MTASSRWQLPASPAVRWHRWDGEIVARVDATGATHLLSPAAAAVVDVLNDPGLLLTDAELLQLLVARPTDDDRQALLALLHGLHALGIVACVAA